MDRWFLLMDGWFPLMDRWFLLPGIRLDCEFIYSSVGVFFVLLFALFTQLKGCFNLSASGSRASSII